MTEIWKDIEGYEGLYQVSNKGNIFSLYSNKIRKVSINRGYRMVVLLKNGSQKVFKAARLVAKAFPEICGEWFDGCVVDHLNTKRDDDRAENIRVCTQKTNMNNPITKRKQRKYHTTEEKKVALRKNAQKWREKNKEQVKEKNKKWRDNHKDYQHHYYLNHKEEYHQKYLTRKMKS